VAISEKAIHWQVFLDNLYRRGLESKQLKLIVTDSAGGLLDAARTVYGTVPLQVCWVHHQRNLVKYLKKRSHRKAVCVDAIAMFMADNHRQALKLIQTFQYRWHPKEPRAARIFPKDIDLSLTFYSQPKDKWKQLASNNLIERQMREFRRRIKLIDLFRDEKKVVKGLYLLNLNN